MKPKAIVALVVLCLFFLLFKAGAQEETIPPGEANAELEIVPEIPLAEEVAVEPEIAPETAPTEEVAIEPEITPEAATVPEFNVDPGITPDSPFYFFH